jgi:hypothetical protein
MANEEKCGGTLKIRTWSPGDVTGFEAVLQDGLWIESDCPGCPDCTDNTRRNEEKNPRLRIGDGVRGSYNQNSF